MAQPVEHVEAEVQIAAIADKLIRQKIAVTGHHDTLRAQFTVIEAHPLELDPNEGKTGDWIRIEGRDFEPNEILDIYFSSDKASTIDDIDTKVTAYQFYVLPLSLDPMLLPFS